MTSSSLRRYPPRLWLRWLPAMAWACVIFWVSSIPGSRVPGRFGNWAHVIEYLVFGVLLFFALSGRRASERAAVIALLVASAYGITDELHQAFVPLRTPDVADWGRDTLGALIGVTISAIASARLAAWRRIRRTTDGR